MRNVPYQPLLLSLLAAMGAAGCGPDHEKDVSYVAGERQPFGMVQRDMPALPCLPKSDPILQGFNPSCGNRFEVTEGPRQETNAEGKEVCVYHIEYDVSDTCTPGRPLVSGAGVVIASLRVGMAWG